MATRTHIVAAVNGVRTRRARSSPVPGGRTSERPAEPPSQAFRYNAFLSYSRAVDGKLAPALQGALQRFAKPWYRTRALRIFRDDASLSANPDLWSSIEAALADSEFFVLLASPEAARSEWVLKEAAYWREHKPPDCLLIALTDGEIAWDETRSDFLDSEESAVPASLRGAFRGEPRYTDLTWARKKERLSLSDPDFRSAVADIAASLHRRPKEEIAGEEVRQHRRTVRVALSAIVVLAILVVVAALAGMFAMNQRDEARAQRDFATSRYLASQALSEADLPRALLLSLEALEFEDTVEARSALLGTLQRGDPRLAAVLHGRRDDVPYYQDEVRSLAFSPDGKTLASGSGDGTIVLWDVDSRRSIEPPLKGVGESSLAFSPDGKTLAVGGYGLSLWDLEHRRRARPPGLGTPNVVAFSSAGKGLALGTEYPAGKIALWDLERRRRLGHPVPGPANDLLASGISPDLAVSAFSPDGKTVAIARVKGTNILWDVDRGRQIGPPLKFGPISSMAFSPDGEILACALQFENSIILWDVENGVRLRRRFTDTDAIRVLAFSPDGKTLAYGDDETIILWDVWGGRGLGDPLIGHSDRVNALAFSTDGKTLASGAEDRTIILWELERRVSLGSPLRQPGLIGGGYNGTGGVAVSPDGRTLATTHSEDILLWDLRRRRVAGERLTGHDRDVQSVAFSPNGEILASGSEDDTIVLWDVARRRPIGEPLTGHRDWVRTVAFSPDGQTLASSSDDGSIILWDVERRRPQGPPLTAEGGEVYGAVFSPDGKTLASGAEGIVVLWDVESRSMIGKPISGHRDWVRSVAFSPDGKILASGSDDDTIILWDVARRRALGEPLTGHRGEIRRLAFSPDGEMLASGAEDETIVLWDVDGRRPLGGPLIEQAGPIEDVTFGPDGNLITAAVDLIVWDTTLVSWQRRACVLANRNLSQAEWDQFLGSVRGYERTCPDLRAGEGAPADAPAAGD
jgi:WD40 repeat protein